MSPSGRNSPFTAALLKHIVAPGLEIGPLMKRVRTDVIATTHEKQVTLGSFIAGRRCDPGEVK
jgi:hypothetical protein